MDTENKIQEAVEAQNWAKEYTLPEVKALLDSIKNQLDIQASYLATFKAKPLEKPDPQYVQMDLQLQLRYFMIGRILEVVERFVGLEIIVDRPCASVWSNWGTYEEALTIMAEQVKFLTSEEHTDPQRYKALRAFWSGAGVLDFEQKKILLFKFEL